MRGSLFFFEILSLPIQKKIKEQGERTEPDSLFLAKYRILKFHIFKIRYRRLYPVRFYGTNVSYCCFANSIAITQGGQGLQNAEFGR